MTPEQIEEWRSSWQNTTWNIVEEMNMANPTDPDDDTSPFDNKEIPLTEDGRVPYWYTARIMAETSPMDDDPDFWDRWKDETKERE